jgi:acetylornithine deacetylase/succinyl-diaminopimelate desuccinylase-like protein
VGPGSIHVAHTDEEHLAIDEMMAAIQIYESLVKQLI